VGDMSDEEFTRLYGIDRARLERLLNQVYDLARDPTLHVQSYMQIAQSWTRRADILPGAHEQLLAGARAAAARGWRVLPLRPALVDDERCLEGRFAKVSGK